MSGIRKVLAGCALCWSGGGQFSKPDPSPRLGIAYPVVISPIGGGCTSGLKNLSPALSFKEDVMFGNNKVASNVALLDWLRTVEESENLSFVEVLCEEIEENGLTFLERELMGRMMHRCLGKFLATKKTE